jgi:hypothetical protein
MAHPLRDLAYGLVITRRVDRAMADPRAALALCDRWTTDRVTTTGIGRLRTERVSRVTLLGSTAALRRNPPAAIRSRGIWFGIHAVVRRGKPYIEAHMYGNGNTRRRAVIRGEQCRFRHQLH